MLILRTLTSLSLQIHTTSINKSFQLLSNCETKVIHRKAKLLLYMEALARTHARDQMPSLSTLRVHTGAEDPAYLATTMPVPEPPEQGQKTANRGARGEPLLHV